MDKTIVITLGELISTVAILTAFNLGIIALIKTIINHKKHQEYLSTEAKLDTQYIEIVKETSIRYKYILKLRSKYNFKYIADVREIIDTKNLSQFKNINIDKYIRNYVKNNKDLIVQAQISLLDNKANVIRYAEDMKNAPQFMSEQYCEATSLNYKRYNRIENQVCEEITYRNIVIDANVNFDIQYTSPAHRNHYERTVKKSFFDLVDLINEIESTK